MLVAVVLSNNDDSTYSAWNSTGSSKLTDRIEQEADNHFGNGQYGWLVENGLFSDKSGIFHFSNAGPALLEWTDSPHPYLLIASSGVLIDLMELCDTLLVLPADACVHPNPDMRPSDLGSLKKRGYVPVPHSLLWTRQSAASQIEEIMTKGGCDLHLHTTCSDGADSPEAIVEKVQDAGLLAFSITDHDTIAGISPAQQALDPQAIRLVPGVELSVEDSCEIHILGYFPAGQLEQAENFLEAMRQTRRRRNRQLLQKLSTLGYRVDPARFRPKQDGTLGRLHIALELQRQGHFDSVDAAFESLLGEGRPAYIKRTRPTAAEAIWMIRQAGGVAVLAHPAQYGWCDASEVVSEQLLENLERLKKLGLQGVEAFHGEASGAVRKEVSAAALSLGLIRTAGSDSHGANKPIDHLFHGRVRWVDPSEVLVVAALAEGSKIAGQKTWLLARRSLPGPWQGYWELPGGKVEPGESPADSLVREIREELNVEASVISRHSVISFDYPERRVVLVCIEARLEDKTWQLSVHDKARFMTAQEALSIKLLPADILLFNSIDAGTRP